MFDSVVSRRSALGGAALATMAVGAHGLLRTPAHADEPGTTFADTVAWDAAYDVVVLGMGFAGLVSAMEAADAGAKVLICEKAPDGEAGGNSRVCGQFFAYGNDDEEKTLAYLKWMAAGRNVNEGVLEAMAKGIAHMEETLADKYGFDSSTFLDWSPSYCSPEYEMADGSDAISICTTNASCFDGVIYQTLRARLEENYADNIDVWFSSPATELVQESQVGTVIGVKVNRGGSERLVRAYDGVCVCTGGFECNPRMAQEHLDVVNYCVAGGLHNEGDGIVMCEKAGARLWHMAVYEGFIPPAYLVPVGAHNVNIPSTALQGASMIVGTNGKRIYNESLPNRQGHVDGGNGIWEVPRWPNNLWLLIDATQKAAVDEAGGFDPDYVGTLIEEPSIAQAAQAMGCDPETLQQSVDDFDFYCSCGRDYERGRDTSTMRAYDDGPFYALPLRAGILNTQGGPERDEHARVLDHDGNPIPHLYSAGECGGFNACMYQGGSNVAECFTFGQIAGANAAVKKDPLPAWTAPTAVESIPANPGDESDLFATNTFEVTDNERLGMGTGIGGDVPVAVTLEEDGSIASVRVLDNSETEGIGSKAIEQLPEQFVGLSSAEDIDAVDGVSGATITSNALKDAVKQAAGL